MARNSTDLCVNPSDETIHLGPLTVRFLLTGENSTGTIAAFEVVVPGAQRLAAPAHNHNHYEETIYGVAGVLTGPLTENQSTSGRATRSAFRGAPQMSTGTHSLISARSAS